MAIVDDNDIYLGTVSLKCITINSAEFAISLRRKAMGTGYAIEAMKRIISMGFEKYKLSYIYWCVSPLNERALRFYEKNWWRRICADDLIIESDYTEEQIKYYIWYRVEKEAWYCGER